MDFNFSELPVRDRYKLLASVIVPRPIALVTSADEQGRINAAPFSFFNCIGADPPLIVLGIGEKRRGEDKDTVFNIRHSGEFVVNIVTEEIAEAMNICGIDFPRDEDELAAAGLTGAPSLQIAPPRIAEAAAALECREHTTLNIGRNRIILGEVLHFHISDELIDLEKLHVNTEELHAVGRMHGATHYTRTHELFELPRVNYESWKKSQDKA